MLRLCVALLFAPLAWLMQKIRPGVRVLMYHRVADLEEYDQLTVSVATFENQMKILSSGARVVSLEQALSRLHDGKNLREPRVVLSFDDGYLDNLLNALPVLERYKLPAIIFISTDFAEQIDSHPRYPITDDALHLNWEQLRELSQHPLISLGSHTLSHPYLQAVSDEQAREEILESAKVLEKKLGAKVKYFCYPSGDYAERELRLLTASSYEAAVTVAPGVNLPGKFSPFEIKRTEVTARDTAMMFKLKLLGAMDTAHSLLHVRRRQQFYQQANSKEELPASAKSESEAHSSAKCKL